MQFPVVFWLATLELMLVVGLICFNIFKSSVLVFGRNSFFRFRKVNSEYCPYLAVDHSIV